MNYFKNVNDRIEATKQQELVIQEKFDGITNTWKSILTVIDSSYINMDVVALSNSRFHIPQQIKTIDLDSIKPIEIACSLAVRMRDPKCDLPWDERMGALFSESSANKAIRSLSRQLDVYIYQTLNQAGYNRQELLFDDGLNMFEDAHREAVCKNIQVYGDLQVSKIKCLPADDVRGHIYLYDDNDQPVINEDGEHEYEINPALGIVVYFTIESLWVKPKVRVII